MLTFFSLDDVEVTYDIHLKRQCMFHYHLVMRNNVNLSCMPHKKTRIHIQLNENLLVL